jgi:hypothetical protein
LEAKGGEGYEKFRSKRDGYGSDEAEQLRRARKAPPPKDYDERQERSLPLRGKPRDPIDGVEYGPPAGGEVRRRRT